MNSSDMFSLFPDANALLNLPVPEKGRLLLTLLTSPASSMPINHHNFFNRAGDWPERPKYGDRQPDVDATLCEAWAWLEGQAYLAKAPNHGTDCFTVTQGGKHFCNEQRDERSTAASLSLVDEGRLERLRQLASPSFDFGKLVRLCEELNIAYREKCYFATGMLTRGLLDHVPPIFGKVTFTEVANNYSGGGKSFKEAIQHLDSASRKIADSHLHSHIRKREMLPTAQQVHCGQQLDMLLAEIMRITP